MLFYQVYVLILTVNLYPQHEQSSNSLFGVSTYNHSLVLLHSRLFTSAYEVFFANDLNIDTYTVLFYHFKHCRIVPLSMPIEFKQRHHIILTILLISGDISLNPGPVKYPCGFNKNKNKNKNFYCQLRSHKGQTI